MADYGYDPTPDYGAGYNALKAKIAASYAGSRGQLNQDLASRGVQTSGVSAIPVSSMLASEAAAGAGGAEDFALEQARTGVREKEMGMEADLQRRNAIDINNADFSNRSVLARRLAQNQLAGQLGAGSLAAIGSIFQGQGI